MTDTDYTTLDFICPRTGRTSVFLRDFAASEFNGKTNAYTYTPTASAHDIDPWATIDSIDAQADDDTFSVWFSSGICQSNTPGETLVFVRASIAATLKSIQV